MTLHYKEYGEGFPLIILHGLFGSLDNWQSLSKRFGEHRRVIAVDQRNHGHSYHTEDMDYALMAGDVLRLMDELDLEQTDVIGHSMGGKTTMKLAMMAPDRIRKMVVADIGPKEYSHKQEKVLAGLFALHNAENLDSRKKAGEIISEHIDEVGVQFFLLKNLYWKEKGKLELRVNLPVIAENIDEIVQSVGDEEVETETLFLRGSRSDYITDEDIDDLESQFSNSEVHTIDDAGHWLHAEQQDSFYEEVAMFLDF